MIDLEVRNIAHLGGDAIRDRAFSVTVAHEQDPLHDGAPSKGTSAKSFTRRRERSSSYSTSVRET